MSAVDTVVVGSGLAGLSMAVDTDSEVVVLEAGTVTDRGHKNTLSEDAAVSLWHRPETDPTFRRLWTSLETPHFERGSGLRQRLGGRAQYWHGVCLPIDDAVLESGAWPDDVAAELTGAGPRISSYAATVEHLEQWMTGHGVRHGMAGSRGRREDSLLACLADAGYRARPVPQASWTRVDGRSVTQIPYSPVERLRSPRIEVKTDHRVLSIRPRGAGCELRVQHRGREIALTARRVVLAAGTFENTRLVGQLLLDLSGQTRISFSGLNDHIVQGFVANVPKGQFPIADHLGRAFCYAPAIRQADSNLFWEVLPDLGHATERLAVWTMGEKQPGASRVTVARPDPSEVADVYIEQPVTDADLAVAERQRRVLAEVAATLLHSAVPAADYRGGSPAWLDAMGALARGMDSDRVLVHPYVYPMGSVDHESGTLPLGGDLLDDWGNLHAAPGVSVIGPATFPRSGAADPSLTMITLARGHLARGGADLERVAAPARQGVVGAGGRLGQVGW